jgi:poly(A) polymerase
MLKEIDDGPLPVRVWNPRIYLQDRSHRMPIITPAYPSMCSTHNVTQSTQLVTTEECSRAAGIVDDIFAGKSTWGALFEKDDFFHHYKHYLQIVASSDDPDILIKWAGFVESKLRQFIMKLELVENLEVAHPYIKGYDRTFECATEKQRINAHHGNFLEFDNLEEQVDTSEKFEVPVKVCTTTFYVGLRVSARNPASNSKRELDFSYPKQEFQKLLESWDLFDLEHMGTHILHIKS